MDIVWVASEMAPFSKTGGLGDVAGALPKALAARGHRVMAISPRYKHVPDARPLPLRARFHLFGQDHEVGYLAVDRDGVRWVLVDNPCFHRRGIYGDDRGAYGDNLFRYALLSKAAIEAAASLPFKDAPLGERVVFHANDWHTGLLPVYLDAHYRAAGRFRRSATVLGLHNLGHQGSTRADEFSSLDLAPRWWPTLDMSGRLNPLKAGIVSADALVAVSPTYARQIQHDHGFGLESVLRMRNDRLIGILNGIDEAWDPKTDRHLSARFDADDLSGKAICKQALQKELGLPRHDVPLFGLVSRLDHQKGIDLVEQITPWLMMRGVQLVILGSGSPKHEDFVRSLQHRWPHQARGRVGFDEGMAHKIEAGADVFLMPSRFEPCGLNQMYSQRYGTVPIVHATGGLADTVTTVDPNRTDGTGWAFHEFTAEAFGRSIDHALLTYGKFPAAWRKIQHNGMTTDFSWDRSASLYEKVYERVLSLRS
ncbi:MAG: glycogen synthase [Alphaproteobacteria bacterium]|nr:glycogen synthase [Alphaproteobacteria bacterium]